MPMGRRCVRAEQPLRISCGAFQAARPMGRGPGTAAASLAPPAPQQVRERISTPTPLPTRFHASLPTDQSTDESVDSAQGATRRAHHPPTQTSTRSPIASSTHRPVHQFAHPFIRPYTNIRIRPSNQTARRVGRAMAHRRRKTNPAASRPNHLNELTKAASGRPAAEQCREYCNFNLPEHI